MNGPYTPARFALAVTGGFTLGILAAATAVARPIVTDALRTRATRR